MMRLFFLELFLIPFFAHCSFNKTVTSRNQLSEQILTIRPGGKPVLSNLAWDYGTDKEWGSKIAEYDLKDELIRKSLFEFQFICKVGGKLYKVCADKPGFCRISYASGKGWFSKKVKTEEYISIEEKYEFLVQARTTCFSQLRREFDEVD